MGKVLSLNAVHIANEIIENIDLAEDILWEDYGRIEAGFRSSVLKILPFKNDDVINSVESIHMSGPENGQMTHYSLSWNGRCQKVSK